MRKGRKTTTSPSLTAYYLLSVNPELGEEKPNVKSNSTFNCNIRMDVFISCFTQT
jgi:hypothetical protein